MNEPISRFFGESMTPETPCPECGNPLPNDTGVCPQCVLALGIKKTESSGTPGFQPTLDGIAGNAPRPEELVAKFPNLEIQHLVGHGGMGAVYQARQKNLDRIVALKILSPKLGNDPAFAERFMREARTLAKLAHPNIITVFDFGEADHTYYLIMEFVDGVNLRDAISEGHLTTDEALSVIPQICDALQYAHDEGVVHRDIKPENILLDKRGRVKIADFGLAKLLDPTAHDFTLTGTQQVLGTRNYMAPEQIERPTSVDHRADIYSLGVVFYELLTGELPIGRFDAPSKKAAVTDELDEVVLRTLEKEPRRRFQQASELRTAVESINAVPPVVNPPVNAQVDRGTGPQAGNRANHHAAAFAQPNPSKAATHESPQQAAVTSIPFTIDELFVGMGCAYGIARLGQQDLELEYEIRDSIFGSIKSETRHIKIPYREIVATQFRFHKIEIRTDSLDGVKNVPNAKHGKCALKTAWSDRVAAREFVNEIKRTIGQPIDEYNTGPDPANAKSRLNGPRIGLIIAGILNCVIIASTLLAQAAYFIANLGPKLGKIFSNGEVGEALLEVREALAEVDRAIPLLSKATGVGGIAITAVVTWLLFTACSRMRTLKDYNFVFAIMIVCMIPLQPSFWLTLPFAIWAMVNLQNPSVKASFDLPDPNQPAEKPGVAPRGRHHFIRDSPESFRKGFKLLMVVIFLSAFLAFLNTVKHNNSKSPTPTDQAIEQKDREPASPDSNDANQSSNQEKDDDGEEEGDDENQSGS